MRCIRSTRDGLSFSRLTRWYSSDMKRSKLKPIYIKIGKKALRALLLKFRVYGGTTLVQYLLYCMALSTVKRSTVKRLARINKTRKKQRIGRLKRRHIRQRRN